MTVFIRLPKLIKSWTHCTVHRTAWLYSLSVY